MTLIYLDNGATSFPKPEEVYRFMDYFYRHFGVNPGRSGYDLCLEAGQMVDETRRLLNDFFQVGDPNRVCFGYNSTDALNLAIFGLLEPGDHAITTTLEHNSVLRPLYHLSLTGVEIDYVAFDCQGFVDPGEIKKRIKKNTKLVVINHASNVMGTIQPIKEIGQICKEKGVIFLVDASQSAGKIPVSMKDMNLDVVAFTGHKSLLGPTGIGGLCVGPEVKIRITRAGGTGVRSAQKTHLEEYPWRLEYGTANLLGLSGLNAGIKWILTEGLDKIHEQEMHLTRMLVDGLKEIEGVTLYCQDNLARHIGVIPFNVNGLEAQDTGILLDVDYNIACRTGLHCAPLVHEQLGTNKIKGAVRFGIGPFNTENDIKAAIRAVAEVADFQREKGKKKTADSGN
ncbi:MAG TPA: aminotransferase class V-fold PLP-dependent enzyme [Candidatus Saccharicenans sp.]|jgi:cysteine desulfurase family protein|nr:aminotransferase class V-fold PLP-dependent enzyme [Candidatus Saccharicenans sp.]HRD01079.1 aminotransferase class V-fold PLP-dependent enzyme [Candidatus Saccharicenans sp.]